MKHASPLLSRLLALALLAGAIAVLALVIVLPVMAKVRDTRDELAYSRDMVQRLSLRSPDRLVYEERIAALADRIADSDLYIRGETGPLAAAAVQQHVKETVAGHGGGLRSVQSLETVEEDGLTRIGVKVVLNTAHDDFVEVLHALETGKPYLFVDRLDISTAAGGRAAARDGAELALAVELEVHGYLSPEVAP